MIYAGLVQYEKLSLPIDNFPWIVRIVDSKTNIMMLLNIVSLFASITVLVVAFLALRNDKITLVRNVLRTKANEANSYLSGISPSDLDTNLPARHIADVLRVISCTDLLLGIYISTNRIPFVRIPTSVLLDEFYLQLHSKVKDWLKNDDLPNGSQNISADKDLFIECRHFLAIQICKDKDNSLSSHKFSLRFL